MFELLLHEFSVQVSSLSAIQESVVREDEPGVLDSSTSTTSASLMVRHVLSSDLEDHTHFRAILNSTGALSAREREREDKDIQRSGT